ncbi:hypothetical protein HC766_04795 [Candidatus Gracilibacteria bacterium]|nr:hypothetical protein [Candidatus Gracilibacteria bacterium]
MNNISYQNLIKGLRKVHMEAVRREIEVQVEPNKVYSTSNIQYFDSENNVIAEVKLFMETSKKWYVLKQTKIFHIQIDTKTSFIDQESYDNINKNLDKVREDVMDGFEDFKDRFKLSFG